MLSTEQHESSDGSAQDYAAGNGKAVMSLGLNIVCSILKSEYETDYGNLPSDAENGKDRRHASVEVAIENRC
jgi:hypothetical protein